MVEERQEVDLLSLIEVCLEVAVVSYLWKITFCLPCHLLRDLVKQLLTVVQYQIQALLVNFDKLQEAEQIADGILLGL